jgi:ribonuclease HII
MHTIIGVDEVGRGALAGPLCVCALRLTSASPFFRLRRFKDSKRLSKKMRLRVFDEIKAAKRAGELDYSLAYIRAREIDALGMAQALKLSVRKVLRHLKALPNERIVLDGGLRAPERYMRQKSSPRADERFVAVALASIVAKCSRDTLLIAASRRFPDYGFETNVGYGTRAHCKALLKKGPTSFHRTSFLRGIFTKRNVA